MGGVGDIISYSYRYIYGTYRFFSNYDRINLIYYYR